MPAHGGLESGLGRWPWLLMQGDGDDGELATHANEKINSSIGPVIHLTDGGVLVELLGHDRMKSALTYRDAKLHYDFNSRLYELYDVEDDPGEQENPFRTSGEAQRYRELMRKYRAFRLENARHRVIE